MAFWNLNADLRCLTPAAGKVQDTQWKHVRVGDIVEVRDNEDFPADLLCLFCELEDGVCYIKTTNLDGKTVGDVFAILCIPSSLMSSLPVPSNMLDEMLAMYLGGPWSSYMHSLYVADHMQEGLWLSSATLGLHHCCSLLHQAAREKHPLFVRLLLSQVLCN